MPRWPSCMSSGCARCCRGGPCYRPRWPSRYISAISRSRSWAFCSSSRIICRALASADTRWRLASSISFCLWRLRFLRRRARSCSCSSAETPRTSPSSVRSAPSGGAKPRGGCGCPSRPQVRRASSSQVRGTWSSAASWWVEWVSVRALPFFAASSAAFAASSALELAFLGAIAGGFFVARTVGAKVTKPLHILHADRGHPRHTEIHRIADAQLLRRHGAQRLLKRRVGRRRSGSRRRGRHRYVPSAAVGGLLHSGQISGEQEQGRRTSSKKVEKAARVFTERGRIKFKMRHPPPPFIHRARRFGKPGRAQGS
jgi:hypothetical protein